MHKIVSGQLKAVWPWCLYCDQICIQQDNLLVVTPQTLGQSLTLIRNGLFLTNYKSLYPKYPKATLDSGCQHQSAHHLSHYIEAFMLSSHKSSSHLSRASLIKSSYRAIVGCSTNSDSIDTHRITISCTRVPDPSTISRCPHVDGALAIPTLQLVQQAYLMELPIVQETRMWVALQSDNGCPHNDALPWYSLTSLVARSSAICVNGPGPATVSPWSGGPQLLL